MTSDLHAALEAAYAQSKQPSLDEEYNRFVQRALEERERLRAERETRVPEPEPDEGRKTAAAAASLLRDGKRITVQAAAILLAYYLGLSNAKSNDSNLRYEIRRNTNNMAYRKLEELIFQRAREGRFDLIDPILGTSIAHPQNPDRYWLIEPMAFEVIKSEVVRQPASPTMIIPPIQGDDGEAESAAPANLHNAESDADGRKTAESETAAPLGETETDAAASESSAADPAASNKLQWASDPQICHAIIAVYERAKQVGEQPPNIKDLRNPVQQELRKTQHRASGNHIMALGKGYSDRRRKPGKTKASEKRKAAFTK
jgi:hypothetical protein